MAPTEMRRAKEVTGAREPESGLTRVLGGRVGGRGMGESVTW
jgi:hypothetical protein